LKALRRLTLGADALSEGPRGGWAPEGIQSGEGRAGICLPRAVNVSFSRLAKDRSVWIAEKGNTWELANS
jgi:hypothetical protein